MSEIQIEEIFTSDNIKQFMDKCNENFASIVENGGGPRGRKGADGETGATGKRGNKFHYVPINDPDSPFDAEMATAAISEIEDIEDGDFVFFSIDNRYCYAGFVLFEETSDGFVPTISNNNLVSLQGPKGEKGDKGDASTEQFESDGDVLTLRNPFQQIILPEPDEGQLSSQPSSTLCIVRGGIGFVSGDREKSAIKSDTDTGEFTISSELNVSLASRENVSIGDYGNGTVSQNVNIIGKNVSINSDGTTNRITLDQNNVKIFGSTVFDNAIQVGGNVSATGNISATQKVTAPTIETNAINVTNLGSLGSVKVNNVDGFNVGDGAFRVMSNSQKKVSIGSVVECANTIKAKVGNDNLYLGVPKFTFMLYPKTATAPSGWCEFTDNLIMPIVTETNYTNQTSYQSGNNLWFKYKVPTTNNGQTTYSSKYVKINLTNAYQAVFDITKVNNITTTTSSASSGTSSETYNFIDNIVKNGAASSSAYTSAYTSASTEQYGKGGSSGSASYSAPTYITPISQFVGNDEIATVDYDITIDDDDDLPWLPVVPPVGPSNTLNSYQQLIKHILTNKNSLQDMSGIFTRMSIKLYGQTNTTPYYILSVPEVPSSVLKWIFKVS